MGRKRKQGGTAVPSNSKSSRRWEGPSSASSALTVALDGTGGGGSGSAPIAPSSDTGGGFNGQLHPLMNPVVLSNLFSFCPPRSLANCRLVCRTWLDDSLPAWRSSVTPKFAYHEKRNGKSVFLLAGEKSSSSKSSSTPVSEFLKFWDKECSTGAYQNFHLTDWEFGMRGEEARSTRGRSQTERLLQLMGTHAKKLTLAGCKFSNVAEFGRVICQSFPNLQTLILLDPKVFGAPLTQPVNNPASLEPIYGEQLHLKSIFMRFNDPDFSTSIPMSWLELLSHFPSLTSVNVSIPPWEHQHTSEVSTQRFLEAVRMIRGRDSNKLANICLDTDGSLELSNVQSSRELFGLIRQLNVFLASVKIHLSSDLDLIENLLTFHGKTLKKIEFCWNMGPRSCGASALEFPFGVMLSNLQELTICDVIGQSMDFLKYTPNLKTLRMVNLLGILGGEVEPQETELVSSTIGLEEMKLPTLKHLYYGYQLNRDDLNRLFNWFPNLETLTAFLNDEQFALVCDNWQGLKHLHVLGEELTDLGITGMAGIGRREIEAGAVRPNITYLKGLECFQMERSRTGLRDVSVFHGFLKLPKLRHFAVGVLCSQYLRQRVRYALRKHIADCHLDSYEFRDLDNEQRDWCPDFAWNVQPFGI